MRTQSQSPGNYPRSGRGANWGTFIPPYDFMDVIEGQATCALELLEDQPDLDIVMAPVGGGGLLGGNSFDNPLHQS